MISAWWLLLIVPPVWVLGFIAGVNFFARMEIGEESDPVFLTGTHSNGNDVTVQRSCDACSHAASYSNVQAVMQLRAKESRDE